MINLELLNESEPIELELEENSKNGTNNYNDLSNKPKINGTELQGSLTLEDLGIIANAVKDILINGTSIVAGGVANIPIASADNLGLVRVFNGLKINATTGQLYVSSADINNIKNRTTQRFLASNLIDDVVKVAMTDGKGETWTTEEKASARMRIGIDTWEEVLDVTLEEDATQFVCEFSQPYRELYIYVSQDNVEEIMTGMVYVVPLLLNDTSNSRALNFYTGEKLTTSFPDVTMKCVNHDNMFIEVSHVVCNAQKNTTPYKKYSKYYDKALNPKLTNHENLNFYGLFCNVSKANTRIRVLGVKV